MAMRLMIVDGNVATRAMIRRLVEAPGDFVVECATADEAMLALDDFKPGFVTINTNISGLCPFQATRNILAVHPVAHVVVLSDLDRPDHYRVARAAGAVGVVLKQNLPELYLYVATKRLVTELRG